MNRMFLPVATFALLLASTPATRGDPSSTEVCKFYQSPMIRTDIDDTIYGGHDEISVCFFAAPPNGSTNFYQGQWMADDFADKVEADIVHIEWWGSYQSNFTNLAIPHKFLIEFLSDLPDPDGPGTNYSRPLLILSSQIVHRTTSAGHPSPGLYTETVVPGSRPDELVYKYNAHLKFPFHQLSNTVYWLKIVALVDTNIFIPWGWHSRDYTLRNTLACTPPDVVPGEHISGSVGSGTNVWHCQDDAVVGGPMGLVLETNNDTFVSLAEIPTNCAPQKYVIPHDGPPGIENFSKDLAFALYYDVPAPECPKWSQEPDCEIGVDVESWNVFETPFPTAPLVADDWLCDGRPITAIEWWGSYIGWQPNNPGVVPPPPLRPDWFRVTWYTDIPAVGEDFSHPGVTLASEVYAVGAYGVTSVAPGTVSETAYCNSQLSFISPTTFEHEYRYYVYLTNGPWNEKDGTIYWLSVQAIYSNTAPTFPWGWKTTPPKYNFNDDAVQIKGPVTNEMFYPPPGWGVYTNHPYTSQSVNMAYRLLTDVCPARCKKWQQHPDISLGDDMESWSLETSPGMRLLRADDFISDGRPITDIHWWGSYMNWLPTFPGDPSSPIPAPTTTPFYPLGFLLSWHLDSGACTPGTLLTNLFVDIADCHEVYYGDVIQFWKGPNYYEHEYQYYVDLANPQLGAGPWLETNNVHYWLNIQAIFPTNFAPNPGVHTGWGWKKTFNIDICPSVVATNGGPWSPDILLPPYPLPGPFDLAFELTTSDVPTGDVDRVAFTRIRVTNALGIAYMTTTGRLDCGRQILQATTNLLLEEAGWFDVSAITLPRLTNEWTNAIGPPARHYRIKASQ